MNCPKCQFVNPVGMKFCGNCGNKLNALCPSCNFENPPDFKFCGNCGTSLVVDASVPATQKPEPQEEPVSREQGERRHLTVMFCDVVGSTAMSHALDPEDLRTIIKGYQGICGRIIGRYDGHVAQYLGDGLMVYFGYPTAHENDGHRAVSSALGILEAIVKYNVEIQTEFNVSIGVRIGIHTGNVVIGQIGGGSSAQDLALGATPNIAARLEGLAEPGNVVVSAATHKLIKQYFNFKPLGPQPLKGVEEPMPVYQVTSASVAKYRYEEQMSSNERKTLIGRDEEVRQLQALWDLVDEGNARVVTIHGEPGLGKSSLVDAAMRMSTEDSNAWIIYHECSEYHSSTAFHTIAHAILNGALQVKPTDSIEDRVEKLEAFALQAGYDLPEMLPLFAQIMSIPLDNTAYSPSPYSPEQQREKLIEAVIFNFLRRSSKNRLLLIFEDLQWMDSATLEIVNRMITKCQGHRILMVLTYRPEFIPEWGNRSHLTDISLRHLRSDSAYELIERIAGDKQLPPELTEEIVKKTDGIPLFVEELTKTILNSDLVIEEQGKYVLNKPLSQISIPSTLHDSLEARLDRMSHTKEVAQFGASIGRDFEYGLIVDASPMQESAIQSCLNELVDAEILTQKGLPPDATYQFRHALIMDAAYASLLKSNRVIIHGRIAKAMEQNQRYVQESPEAIAYHFGKSSSSFKAVAYWIKAAQKARTYQSFEEALVFIDQGLKLLPQIERSESLPLEAELLAIKAPTHLAIESYGSSNAYSASLKLYELANRLDDDQFRFKALRTMITYEVFSGQPAIALKNAQDVQALANKLGTSDAYIEGLRLLGLASLYVGNYKEAVESFDLAYESYRALGQNSDALNRNQGIFSLAQSSHCMWYLGYPDQALERARLAVELSVAQGAVQTQAMAYFIHCINCSYVGNWDELLEFAARGREITEEYGFRMFSNEIQFIKGLALARTGAVDEGLKLMETSLKWRTSVGLVSASHLQTTILAEELIRHGHTNKAREVIKLSKQLIASNDDQLFRPEVYRVEAILLHTANGEDSAKEVEELLHTSLKIAREHQTRSFEIRTLMTMLELASSGTDRQTAAQMLRELYEQFTEGLDSPDLARAASLIDNHSDVPRASNS